MCATMPSNSGENSRGRAIAPSADAASMIVNSGAPLMNARPMMMRSRVIISSVPRSHPHGWELAAHEVIDVDHHVEERMHDDQHGADRQERDDRRRRDQLVAALTGDLVEHV